MAAEQEIRNMSEDNIFDALMEQYGKAAGESISAMLKTKVEIKAPEKSETLVKDVEYSILEPALFVKSCLTSNAAGNIVMILSLIHISEAKEEQEMISEHVSGSFVRNGVSYI